jgi:hypothetical protein
MVPIARLMYEYIWVDPIASEPRGDPSWSDALYFAVECQDYSFPQAPTPRERLDLWLDWADAEGLNELRLPSVASIDLPCLYWPSQPGDVPRPTPITDPPYVTLVLTADTDPATPMANAMRVYSRLDDAYLVVNENGPHVIFDWGVECVDNVVSDFLATGQRPPTRITLCDGEVADPYVANAPDEASEYDGRKEALAISADQIANNAEYAVWDAVDDLIIGCDWGGTITLSPGYVDTDLLLDDCEFTDHFPLSGTGRIDADGVVHLGGVSTPIG